jgi:Zn-dependent protease with chaperone function
MTTQYDDATAALGYQYAMTVREWLVNTKADSTAHANQWSEMCALYFDQWWSFPKRADNIAADYCDDNEAMLEAYEAIHGEVGDDLQSAFPAMDEAYDFAVSHIFIPAGNGDGDGDKAPWHIRAEQRLADKKAGRFYTSEEA